MTVEYLLHDNVMMYILKKWPHYLMDLYNHDVKVKEIACESRGTELFNDEMRVFSA